MATRAVCGEATEEQVQHEEEEEATEEEAEAAAAAAATEVPDKDRAQRRVGQKRRRGSRMPHQLMLFRQLRLRRRW